MFVFRALRRFSDARALGQVGRLLGIFECFAEFFPAFIVKDVNLCPLVLNLRKSVFQLAVSSAAWRVLIGFEKINFESW